MGQNIDRSVESVFQSLSNDTLADTITNAFEMAFLLDKSGEITAVSAGVSATLGYDEDWLTGKAAEFLLANEPQSHFEFDVTSATEFRQLVLDEKRNQLTLPIKAADDRMVALRLHTIESQNCLVCLAHDFTEVVSNQSQQDSKPLQEETCPMYVLDADGVVKQVNDMMVEYTGHKRNQLVGSAVSTLHPGDEGKAIMERLDALTTTSENTSTTLNLHIQSKSGVDNPANLELTTLSANLEGLTAFVGIFYNTSSEIQRKHVPGVDRSTINSVVDPLYVLDEQGHIERVNDSMVAYTGYDRAELIGRTIGELVPGDEYAKAKQRLFDIARDDERNSGRFNIKIITKHGDIVQSEANVKVLSDDDGLYLGSIGTLRDISDQVQREQELGLLKRVLTRVFRHNIRNELTVVRGNAELIEARSNNPIDEYAETILETTQRLLSHSEKARLIEEVIETDKQLETDVSKMVADVVESVRTTHTEADICIDVPASTTIKAHPQIRRAIQELVENAIQHAPADSRPQIDIWTERSHGFVTLFVEDESGGLAESELSVLREGDETSLEHGSGVGLWLVRWLVEHSDGTLIASQTGDGTIMGIRFGNPGGTSAEESTNFGTDELFAELPAESTTNPTPTPSHDETFVGRTQELHTLEKAYDALVETGGHAAFVTGETGVGKTTLVDAFEARLSEQNNPPLFAAGYCEQGLTPPYYSIKNAISDLPVATELDEMLDDIAEFSQSTDSEQAEAQKEALFVKVAEELREVAQSQPIVLTLEDLQWADEVTIELLEFLLDEVGYWSTPILFVCTYNTEQVTEDHPVIPLAASVDEAGRGVQTELSPFTVDEVERLLSQALNTADLPHNLVTGIHEHTGGNPLFASEIGQHLAQTLGTDPASEDLPTDIEYLSLPEGVEKAVSNRLDRVLGPTQSLLELGAVIGERPRVDILVAASTLNKQTVEEQIHRLVHHRLWKRDGDTVTFVHGLVREKTIESLETDHLTELHARVADAIETVHADSLENHYAQLAAHHHQANNPEAALTYYQRASRQAKERYAVGGAKEYNKRSIEIAEDINRPDAILSAYRDLAELTLISSEYEDCEYYIQQIQDRLTVDDKEQKRKHARLEAELARNRGEFAAAVDAANEGLALTDEPDEVHCRLLSVKTAVQSETSDYDAAEETAREYRELATELGEKSFQAEANRQVALVVLERSEYDSAREYLETALEQIRAVGDRHEEAHIQNSLGVVAYTSGDPSTARAYYEQSLETFDDIGDRHQVAKLYNNLGICAENLGESEQAKQYYEQALETGKKIGDRYLVGGLRANLSNVERHLGNLKTAKVHAETALRIYEAIESPHDRAIAMNHLARTIVILGKLGEAREYLVETRDIYRDIENDYEINFPLRDLAEIARKRGNFAAADEHLTEAEAVTGQLDHPEANAKIAISRAWLAYRQHEYDQAYDYADQAREKLDGLGLEVSFADALHALGTIEIERENYETAREFFTEAQERYESDDARIDAAAVERDIGRLAIVENDFDRAEALLRSALETAESTGAVFGIARTRYELGRLTAKTDGAVVCDHWERALDIFEDVTARPESLDTLELLVSHCGDNATEKAIEWCEMGVEIATELDTDRAAEMRGWFQTEKQKFVDQKH